MRTGTAGFVGLGAMGSRMAARLADAGWAVHVHNRTPRRAPHLDRLGITRHDDARTVAENADVVMLMLWDGAAVRSVVEGDRGLAAASHEGLVIADLSTIDADTSVRLAELCAERGGAYFDAPVSGSLDRAERGELLIMAGGPTAAVKHASPALEVLGQVEHVDEHPGSGLALKLAINAQVASQLVAWGEALRITDAAGVPRDRAIGIMLKSVIASGMLQYRVPFMSAPPDEVWASVEQLRKDVGYALGAGADTANGIRLAADLLDQAIIGGRWHLEAVELIDAAHAGLESATR